ncbi:MAG: ABC transporter permease [Peptococcaceae bacterium]|jgi:osmoprotectant transport system permease protein|nr:ABC transporter permease [Peptococcaceae bacterium]
MKKADLVSLFFSGVMAFSLLIPNFMSYKTSRIAFGDPISAHDCFGSMIGVLYLWVAAFIILAFIKQKRHPLNLFTGLFAAVSLAVFLRAVSLSFESGAFDAGGNARMSFGFGFLLVVISLYSIMVKCVECTDGIILKTLIPIVALALVVFFLARGEFNNYSVMREYQTAEKQFMTHLWEHVSISVWVLIAAVIIGVPMGYMCYKHKVFDAVTLIGLSVTEVLPMLALFAIIRMPYIFLREHVPLLKEMGLGGYGAAPAFTALLLYALYLIIHNARAAFSTVDYTLIENARAMGMTPRDVIMRVEIPIALPVILSGIRITMISAIVGATLASYIGAGGLGTYIVNGINSLSIDLQLLGVIPIFFLTVIADAVIRLLAYFLLPMPGRWKISHDFFEKYF